MAYRNKGERLDSNRKVEAGVSKYLKKDFVLNGEKLSPKDISAAYQSEIDASDVVDQLALKLATARKAQHEMMARTSSITAAIKALVVSQYGAASPVLAEFGFSPRKVATKTVAEKMIAVEKTRATRAARHTMGSRQKAAIRGDVSAPAVPAPAATNDGPSGVSDGVANSNGATGGSVSGTTIFAKTG